MIVIGGLALGTSAVWAQEKAPRSLEAPDLVLKTCQSDNLETSLSGMMLSVDLLDNEAIVKYLAGRPDSPGQRREILRPGPADL